MMVIQCPQCQARYRIKDAAATKKAATATCPKCQERFIAEDHQVTENTSRDKTILVVDDAKFFRELIFDILAGHDYQLLAAENAKQAWQLLVTQAIDLVIVDVNLPDLNGYSFIQKMRQQPSFVKLPVLCISGVHRKEDDAIKAIQAGADDFSSKSFHPDDFRSRIKKLIND